MKKLRLAKRVMPKPVFYPLGVLFGAEEHIPHSYNDIDYETIEFNVMPDDDDCVSMFSVFSVDDY